MTDQFIMERYKKEYEKAKRLIPNRRTELIFVKKAVEGNVAAKHALIYKYIPFLYSMAVNIKTKYNATPDELVNAAMFGFNKALRSFDMTRGTSFYTYYIPKALNEMKKASFESLLVRRSEAKLKKQRTGVYDSVADVPIDRKDECGRAVIDRLGSGGDVSDAARRTECVKFVDEFLAGLSDTERKVMNEIYLSKDEPVPLNVVGTSMHLCKERIRQIKIRAIAKMRNSKLYGKLNPEKETD